MKPTRAHRFAIGAYRGLRAEGFHWIVCAYGYVRYFWEALRR